MKDEKDVQRLDLFRMPEGFRGRSSLQVQLWWCVQALLFRPSPQFMYGWRRWLLKQFGAKIGKSVLIRPTATVTYPWKLTIGDHSWVGDEVVLYSLGNIEIGSNAVVSQRSYVCAADHDLHDIRFPIRDRAVSIGDQVWIATDVFIGPGVRIGSGSVVGARSSVFRDLDGGGVYLGSPARFVTRRTIAGK